MNFAACNAILNLRNCACQVAMLAPFSARNVRTQEPNVSCLFLPWHQGAIHPKYSLRPVSPGVQRAGLVAVELALSDKVSDKMCPEPLSPCISFPSKSALCLAREARKTTHDK